MEGLRVFGNFEKGCEDMYLSGGGWPLFSIIAL